jgi:negative regulator of flagellin synthesis FlgM
MKVTDASQIRGLGPGASPDTVRAAAPDRKTGDRVSTDESARLATAIAATTESAGASRAARLQSIEVAVRQGTYRPDPQRIAQEILDDAELAARLQAMLGQ